MLLVEKLLGGDILGRKSIDPAHSIFPWVGHDQEAV